MNINVKLDRINEINIYLAEIKQNKPIDDFCKRVLESCIKYWYIKIKNIEDEITEYYNKYEKGKSRH